MARATRRLRIASGRSVSGVGTARPAWRSLPAPRPLAVAGVLLAVAAPTLAADRTWTGTTSGAWTVPSNWGGTAPLAGDSLYFPTGASNLVTTNDFPAGTSFAQLTVGENGYALGGNGVDIGGGVVSNSTATIDLPLRLTSFLTNFSVTGGTLTLNGTVDLAGFPLELHANGGNGVLAGQLAGSAPAGGGVVKTGPGDWTLTGANTFPGAVGVNVGRLIAGSAGAFGVADDSLDNATIVNGATGGSLVLGSFAYPTERIILNAFGPATMVVLEANGNATLAGTVELANDAVLGAGPGQSLTLDGIVTGPGRLGLAKAGTFVLANPGNDFTGGVAWGAAGTPDSTLRLGASQALPASVALDVGAGGVFDLDGFTQTAASLAGSGNTDLGSGGALTLTNPTGTYSGAVTGTGLVVVAGGDTRWTGASTFAGGLTHTGGTFLLDGAGGGALSAPFTQTAGTFGLSNGATAGAVAINGDTFAPGLGGNGIANTASLSLAAAATYAQVINGTAATLFSNVHVTGTVSLGGASLQLSGGGGDVGLGTQLVIIDNDGVDPVVGTFAGLPEGGVVSGGPGGLSYEITYAGGTGNDVALRGVAVAEVPALDALGLAGLGLVMMILGSLAIRRRALLH
jgi:autotransporter-associated beta strand protein